MKQKLLAGGAVLLVVSVFAGAAYASANRVSWKPERLAPESVAPGESRTFTVILTNEGPSSLETGHLNVSLSGDVASLATVERPKFPKVVKRGASVPVVLSVRVPGDAPMAVIRGELSVVRPRDGKDDDGKDHEWRGKKSEKETKKLLSKPLPVEITVSRIPLPPDPGEAGRRDLLGIDSDGNGVRDDIDRYIAFQFPDSERKRAALTQYAQELQIFLRDSDDKEKTIANAHAEKGQGCVEYVFWNVENRKSDETLLAEVLNTPDRSKAYVRAESHLGGQVFSGPLLSELQSFLKSQCSFDPDMMAN
jgi:hypothetical protein